MRQRQNFDLELRVLRSKNRKIEELEVDMCGQRDNPSFISIIHFIHVCDEVWLCVARGEK